MCHVRLELYFPQPSASPESKLRWPSKPNILAAHFPSAGAQCEAQTQCSWVRTSLIVMILLFVGHPPGAMDLDYTMVSPLQCDFIFVAFIAEDLFWWVLVLLIRGCFVNGCNFGGPVRGGELRVLLLHYLGQVSTFISDYNNLSLSFFLVHLAESLLTFSKNQLSDSLIFFIVFLVSILFISVMLLQLPLGFVCCFSIFLIFFFSSLWVFVAGHRLSLVAENGGFSCGARALGTQASVVAARGLSSCGAQAW